MAKERINWWVLGNSQEIHEDSRNRSSISQIADLNATGKIWVGCDWVLYHGPLALENEPFGAFNIKVL